MAGGGGRGKEGGIARAAMTQAGNTIETRLLFIVKYPITGEMTTENDNGGANNGTFNRYLTGKSRKTGKAGKRAGIGKKTKHGAFRICNARGSRDTRLKGSNTGSPGDTEETMNKETESDDGIMQYSFSSILKVVH